MPNAELLSREENVARVRVAIEPAEVDTAFKAVYRQLAGQLSVPGFRKGKVPPNVVRQRVGAETVADEVDDRLREFAVRYGLAELKLTPRAANPRFEEAPKPSEGEPAQYEFSMAVLPEVTIPDYSGWTLEVPKVELDESLRQRYLQRLIDRFTTTEEKDGPAEPGDLITIGIHSKLAEDGSEAPFGGHDIGFVLDREGNLPGWDAHLAAAKAGEERDFEYAMPADFADARVAGKTLSIHVHIDKVEQLIVPVIDDAFIREKLHLDGEEQLREYMDASLEREIAGQLEAAKREAAMQRVVAELTADVSEDMVRDEVNGMVQENDRALRRHGGSLDEYLQQKAQSLADYRDGLQEAALSRIRFFLAAKTIADQEGFEATQDDFSRYAYMLMQREGLTHEQLRELMGHREFTSEATYQIVLEKVLAHLAETIKFEVKDSAVKDSAPPTAEQQ